MGEGVGGGLARFHKLTRLSVEVRSESVSHRRVWQKVEVTTRESTNGFKAVRGWIDSN